MRVSKRPPPEIPVMDMTPMIDVVFLLIIFFMTVSQISEVKRAKLDLPLVATEKEQNISTLTVNVDEKGTVIVSGKPFTPDEFDALLDQLGASENTSVVLRADRNADSEFVNQVVTLLGKHEISMIRIAVQEPR